MHVTAQRSIASEMLRRLSICLARSRDSEVEMRLRNLEHDNTNLGSLLGGCRMLSAIDRGTVPVVQVIYNHHCFVSEVVIRFLNANEMGR